MLDETKFEIANASDIPSILVLENSTDKDRYTRGMLLSSFDDKHTFAISCKDGEKIIGYVLASSVLNECSLLKIIVDVEYRRRGIGSELLKYLDKIMIEKKVEKIFLEVRSSNLPAINLYKKNGYIQIHERLRYYSDGEDAKIFCKNLIGE